MVTQSSTVFRGIICAAVLAACTTYVGLPERVCAQVVPGPNGGAAQPGIAQPGVAQPGIAQPGVARESVQFRVTQAAQRLEMIINTSRILTMETNVARMLVNNPDIVRATPLSPNQIQLSALAAGVTQLNMWDENNSIFTVDVVVSGDARELQNLLANEFPEAVLRVRALPNSVSISGFVPSAEMVTPIIRMAEDYFPQVINNIMVGGVQQVLLHVKILEVSRTKLRKVGVDWAFFNGNDSIISHPTGNISSYTLNPNMVQSGFAETLAFGIVDNAGAFFGFVDMLRDNGLARILSEPTLTTVSGRPASFNSGGEFPIIVPQTQGALSVEYRQYGTQVEFVPIVLGNGRMRLEVRPQISALDEGSGVSFNGFSVPGLRTRWVDTAVEMEAGQTLALAGLIQTETDARNSGIPWLSDLPWIGAMFRRTQEQQNEIELLIMVTPEFVGPMSAEEVPPCGPGTFTGSPSDVELYYRGYVEVPKCCNDGRCGQCQQCQPPISFPAFPANAPASAVPYGGQQVGHAAFSASPRQPQPGPAGHRAAQDPQYGPVMTHQPVHVSPVSNPQRQQNPNMRLPQQPAPIVKPKPNLIGPVGYDVLK